MTKPKTKKVNLRKAEILGPVKEVVAAHYRSALIEAVRASDHRLRHGGIEVRLARSFGFCYGVERAIDLAYAARRHFEGERIFILGEIIHNPDVNRRLKAMGIRSLSGPDASAGLEEVGERDVVIIPAFGAQKRVVDRLAEIGCTTVDTTCGDVLSVWRRVRQYADGGYTTIIHGKARHEETLATSSWAEEGASAPGHFVVVLDLEETDLVCDAIRNGADADGFRERFTGAMSEGFDPNRHLHRIGLANQTTMLSRESIEVGRRIRDALRDRYGEGEMEERFRHYDTICGATQERQDATMELLDESPDLMLVVGGYNSSNTSHLVEIASRSCPTYFLQSADGLISAERIRHLDLGSRAETVSTGWLPAQRPVRIGLTAGASSPSRILEEVVRRVYELGGAPLPPEIKARLVAGSE